MRAKVKKGLVLLLMCTMILGMKTDVLAAGVTYVYDDAQTVANLTNNFRAANPWYLDANEQKQQCGNLPALAYDYRLERVAMIRAAEIVTSFSHTRPGGGTSSSMVIDSLGMTAWGENIAAGQTSANEVVEAWKETNEPYNGQGHRRNMLGIGTTFTSIGVGHVRANGRDYWVQIFGTGNGGGTREDLNGSNTPDTDKPDQNPNPDTDKPDQNPNLDTDKPDQNPNPDTDKPGQNPNPDTDKPDQTPDADQPNDDSNGLDPDTVIPGIIPSTQYNFVSGAGNTWTKGSGQPMVMKTDGDFSKFVSVEIDGAVVDKSNYAAESGSTIVTFKAEYMETLKSGKHTYRVNYTDGYAETTFTVNGSTAAAGNTVKAPKTGDAAATATSMILMLAAFGGIAASQMLKKRIR